LDKQAKINHPYFKEMQNKNKYLFLEVEI